MAETDQQIAVIEHEGNAVVRAVAGSGKSYTIVQHARRRSKPSLYLAFNRSVAVEAREKFEKAGCKHVTVLTPHSLAYHMLDIKNKFTVNPGDIKPFDLMEKIEFPDKLPRLDKIALAKHVLSCFNNFCVSPAANVEGAHYEKRVIGNKIAQEFVFRHISDINRLAFELYSRMMSKDIAMTHDAYLKIFQLSSPKLDFEYIYADEGQDLSAVMLNIIKKQDCKKIIVGDPHQQLYGFRGAVNSLNDFDFPVFPLTKSFRFTQDIADLGAEAIALKKFLDAEDSDFELIGAGDYLDDSAIKSVAVVARSNIALLNEAIASYDSGVRKLYFESGLSNHTFLGEGASIYDVVRLYLKKKENIESKTIASFDSFTDLKKHAVEVDDKNLLMSCQIADKYGRYFFQKIRDLKKSEVFKKEDAEIIFGTVHRMKGLEFDHVELTGDFLHEEALFKALYPDKKKKKTKSKAELIEDINALYVAITRSKSSIDLPFYIQDFGGEKPPRNAAKIRLAAIEEGAKGWREQAEVQPQSKTTS